MKRILTQVASLFCLTLAFASVGFANVLPFTDVPTTADYYEDLSSLYGRGIISDSADHKFNPESLMNRDDFVAIVVGVSCKKCLVPSFDDILKYTTIPFVDFKRENQNFYCVSYAKEQGIVEGYVIGADGKSACQDGQAYSETPFCAFNKISRIEAAAVLLRQAGLWDNTKNSGTFEKKIIIPDVNDAWYGYAQKAIQIDMVHQDSTGKIRPDEYITKREFVRMAANIFRANLCAYRAGDGDGKIQAFSNDGDGKIQAVSDDGSGSLNTGTGTIGTLGGGNTTSSISAEIRVLDSVNQCSKSTQVTKFPNPTETNYTFFGNTESEGVLEYSWEFARVQDGKRMSASGACLKDFNLPGSGTWLVRLTVKNSAGDSAQSVATVEVKSVPTTAALQSMSLSIRASALVAPTPSTISFTSTLSGGTGPYTYHWDFADGEFSDEKNPDHLYYMSGQKTVQLTVRDSRGLTATAELSLVLSDSDDWDKDGVLNTEDSCPIIFGVKVNNGCPIVHPYNGNTPDAAATSAYVPGLSIGIAGLNGQCKLEYASSSGALFGTPTCSACPCENKAEFNAKLRSCDVIFPAIMSPSRNEIYSRGKVFEVRF